MNKVTGGRRYPLLLATLICVIAITLAGCSKSTTTQTTTAAQTTTAKTTAVQTTSSIATTATTTAPPVSKGEFRIALSSFGDETLDPHLGATVRARYLDPLWDPLVGATADGKLDPASGIAEKWETSADGKTITFYIRKGVKFHDGTELTAVDVKYTIERLMTDKFSGYSYAPQVKSQVTTVDVISTYVVAVNTKAPAPTLLYTFSNLAGAEGRIVPKAYIERVGNEAFNKNPIGTGPYQFASQQIGSFIKYKAVANHWRVGVPVYQYLTFQLVPEESTRVAMLKSGQTDLIAGSADSAPDLLKAGYTLVSKNGAVSIGVHMYQQYDSGPLNDVRVRKALALSINRPDILQYVFGGAGKVASSYIVGSRSLGNDPSLKPYPYDPAQAKQLIEQSGNKGAKLKLYSYARNVKATSKVNEVLAQSWNDIGLNIELIPIEYGSFYDNLWQKLLLQNSMSTHDLGGTLVQTGTLNSLHKSTAKQTFTKDPVYDKLHDEALTASNAAALEKKLGEISKYIYDNYLDNPIVEIADTFVGVKGLAPWSLGQSQYGLNLDLMYSRK